MPSHFVPPVSPLFCRCPSFSSIWLIAINVLYFILGLAMIGLSSWGITQQKEDVVTQGEFFAAFLLCRPLFSVCPFLAAAARPARARPRRRPA